MEIEILATIIFCLSISGTYTVAKIHLNKTRLRFSHKLQQSNASMKTSWSQERTQINHRFFTTVALVLVYGNTHFNGARGFPRHAGVLVNSCDHEVW